MIPQKLHLKNFLSYGTPTQSVDFVPYHLICLSGKNGHGKSSLLDAITWALWGQARKITGSSKADDGLIRLGQSSMIVCLDFIANGNLYRTRREYNLDKGKGTASLDFGIIDSNTQRFQPLTDKTMRQTQAKIEEIVGTFDSFVNSVFLRQGNANEFSKKTPRERKEILAHLLGLEKFESLRKKALEKVRDQQIEKVHVERVCEALLKDIEHEQLYVQQLDDLNKQYLVLIHQESQAHERITALALQKRELAINLMELQQQVYRYNQLDRIIRDQCVELSRLSKQWREVAKQHRTAYYPQETQQRKTTLEIKLADMQSTINRRLTATQEILRYNTNLQNLIDSMRRQHINQAADQTHRCHQLQTTLIEIDKDLAMLDQQEANLIKNQQEVNLQIHHLPHDISLLAEEKGRLDMLEQTFDRRRKFYYTFIARKQILTHTLQDIKAAIERYPTLQNCPLCEQKITHTQNDLMYAKTVARINHVHRQLDRLTKVILSLKEILTQQRSDIQALKQTVQQHAELQVLSTELQATAHKILEAIIACKNKKIEFDFRRTNIHKELETALQDKKIVDEGFSNLLESNQQYLALKTKIMVCEEELAIHTYSETTYASLQNELQHFSHIQATRTNLLQEITLQTQRKEEIKNLCKDIRLLRQEKISLEEKMHAVTTCEASMNTCEQQELLLHQQLAQINNEKEIIAHRRGSIEQAHLRVLEQKEKLQQKFTQKAALETDISAYQTISNALSKDGIQGLLIENIIPEIEQEANNILSRLTNNTTHLIIDSIKDLKSGGTKETLEIKISDTIGIRPYELFSGGEAFRIDFALRLAISKLFARRTGTSLQTLIIDEGFGSQDEEGLTYIMESIYAIQEDFAKIIIVSHLNSMKEQFPTHFHVYKGPRGSTIEVIQQG